VIEFNVGNVEGRYCGLELPPDRAPSLSVIDGLSVLKAKSKG
jgi:hypothetical protein